MPDAIRRERPCPMCGAPVQDATDGHTAKRLMLGGEVTRIVTCPNAALGEVEMFPIPQGGES